ncbi:hypothetical protein GOODEAATRI_001831 [Goodea atripinnis]|uniref:Secreted protein n=1 Tax=Goodea atripinnis TaxID=208336 RepID=A0ABV0NAD1_9TELE
MITLKVLNSIVLLGTSCMFVKEANMEEKLSDPPPSVASSRANSRANRAKNAHTAPQQARGHRQSESPTHRGWSTGNDVRDESVEGNQNLTATSSSTAGCLEVFGCCGRNRCQLVSPSRPGLQVVHWVSGLLVLFLLVSEPCCGHGGSSCCYGGEPPAQSNRRMRGTGTERRSGRIPAGSAPLRRWSRWTLGLFPQRFMRPTLTTSRGP